MDDEDVGELIDRPRGILTKKERKQILGELDEDPDDPTVAERIRGRRRRIRTHLEQSLIDFQILNQASPHLFIPVFDQINEAWFDSDAQSIPYTPLVGGITALFSLLHKVLGSVEPIEGGAPFEHLLGWGVSESLIDVYAGARNISIDPVVSLEIDLGEKVPITEVKAVFDRDEFVTQPELRALHSAGELDYETYIEEWEKVEALSPEKYDELYEQRLRDRQKVSSTDEDG